MLSILTTAAPSRGGVNLNVSPSVIVVTENEVAGGGCGLGGTTGVSEEHPAANPRHTAMVTLTAPKKFVSLIRLCAC